MVIKRVKGLPLTTRVAAGFFAQDFPADTDTFDIPDEHVAFVLSVGNFEIDAEKSIAAPLPVGAEAKPPAEG